MSYSIPKSEIIKYPPEELNSFVVKRYEWIDNLNFLLHPKDCLENWEAYVAIAKKKFTEADWEGEGEIKLMWIPPFLQKKNLSPENTVGFTLWHVKQIEDGTSFLLCPSDLFDQVK